MLDFTKRKPDILDCLANLSNDEVFTSPALANKILDLLPPEVWTNKDLRFLDPACKSGVFLREAAKRLMEGLRDAIPDEAARREHIFKNMLFGMAITELTAHITRRSLYYSKDSSSDRAVVKMATPDGNVFYENTEHSYKGGSCVHCGAPESANRAGTELENHAYRFIHGTCPHIMKFDVIVGNPPYQLQAAGGDQFAVPLYHRFIDAAIQLNPRYLTMVVPSRWFAGGLGLNDFRARMLKDQRIRAIFDYPDASECFPGVEVKGGVNYFLWDRDHEGLCAFSTVRGGKVVSTMERYLDSGDGVLVRSNESLSVLRKVQGKAEPTMDLAVPGQKPFGIPTNFADYANAQTPAKNIKLYRRGGTGWIAASEIKNSSNTDAVERWKVFSPEAGDGSGKLPAQVTGRPFVGEPGSVCSNTYLLVGPFDTELEAVWVNSYLQTKFVRFLISLRKNTHHLYAGSFKFVPNIGTEQLWTDELLYRRYGLTPEEVALIESSVKEMP
jgi:site-specific DNA-methyltransferase (adenine-specific)